MFEFHKLYTEKTVVEDISHRCRKAEVGCVECKKIMAANLSRALEPIREKRLYYESHPELVKEIIQNGNDRARAVARQTMEEVRSAIKI